MATGARAGDHILENFLGTPDGAQSADTLVADTFGNLYGTTMDGGVMVRSVYVMCAPFVAAPDILLAYRDRRSGRRTCFTALKE